MQAFPRTILLKGRKGKGQKTKTNRKKSEGLEGRLKPPSMVRLRKRKRLRLHTTPSGG